jgi:2-C-methyl-D-erythritol 4-phosphate cytidylyltransferase
MSDKAVIIVAGGIGKRMNSDIPKQFLILGTKPILMHTIERFFRYDSGLQIVVVLPDAQIPVWRKMCDQYSMNINHKVVVGGIERFYSVKNGLEALHATKWVAIHDGVRPMVTADLINRCFCCSMENGSAIPVVAPSETVRFGSFEQNKVIPRENVFLVQTPQVFDYNLLKKAYEANFNPNFTDDASVFENAGFNVTLIDGDSRNIKITKPADIELCHSFMAGE